MKKALKILKWTSVVAGVALVVRTVGDLEGKRQEAVLAFQNAATTAHNFQQMFTVLSKHTSEEGIKAFEAEMESELEFMKIAEAEGDVDGEESPAQPEA